ncbi:MAG: DUF3883 domain-containing protein [Candidatus Kapabacteria bacterium]|nr:DUF3883 domain-containing protein [Candidatus Kapabacteria bacterium]
MNIQKVRAILEKYKQHFKLIHKEEIYKWQAVKCFQDNWDINAYNFYDMLNKSFNKAYNLLDSGNYFPKKMLLKNTEINPDFVKELFIRLYDEEVDLNERINIFQEKFKELNSNNFPNTSDYQDIRAIIVYLCLRYPERYYLYKFEMFKKFSQFIDHPYKPVRGHFENILQYLTLCNIVKEEIILDKKLQELHKTRITETEFNDNSLNILTQDIIYATVKHFEKFDSGVKQVSALNRLKRKDKFVKPKINEAILKGRFVNYLENEKANKKIGDLGEILVLQHEQEKLKSLGMSKVPIHKSKYEGDGLGYDILSYDEAGNEIFIEVKTTTVNYDAPFYITRNELERSQKDNNQFYLYRLFEFDLNYCTANYYIHKGDLTELCINPVSFRVIVEDIDN